MSRFLFLGHPRFRGTRLIKAPVRCNSRGVRILFIITECVGDPAYFSPKCGGVFSSAEWKKYDYDEEERQIRPRRIVDGNQESV